MNDQNALPTLDDWQRSQRPRDVLRFAPVVPLSTAGGSCIVTLCLWPVLPAAWWPAWLAVGLALALAQWRARWLIRGSSAAAIAARGTLERRRWTLVNGLVAGLFWGGTSIALFPVESIEHQLLLGCILIGVTALWLPLFALSRISLFVFAVPGLLPMAFALLTSPTAPQMTMGSLLLLLIAVLAGVVQATGRIFFADFAARRALYHQATHDSLVGLANRGEFHRRVQTLEIMHAQAYAILYIDLDHFKEINDTAGHAAGDELLRRIGAILRDTVRKEDTAARLGGDEFAILMENCGAAEAAQVAATILQRINGFVLSSAHKRKRITASIGIACSADLCASPGRLLEAADRACYTAKRSGRNRVEIASGLGQEPARNRMAFALITDVLA
jgi:diguanylate cyclase (GGDEF)-like protein